MAFVEARGRNRGFDVRMTGQKQLMRALDKLPKKMRNKILRKATREGAKISLADAKANVPVDTGALEASLTVRAAKRGRGRRARQEVGHQVVSDKARAQKAGAESTYYSHFVEFGTEKWEGDAYLVPSIYAYDQQRKIYSAFARSVRANWPGLISDLRRS